MEPSPPSASNQIGLCQNCVHQRVHENARGSRFYQCGRASDDTTYARYPRLPVLRCTGFEASDTRSSGPAPANDS